MPRDASGDYSLPEPLVVAGQTVLADWANNSFADFSTTFTDSLSRSGNGGMLAQLRIAPGSAPAPSISWTNETTSGLYRASAGDIRMSVQGIDATRWEGGELQKWTGSVWEDFLTESSASGLPDGTVTNAMLRWSGTEWVQNANILVTAPGALKITGALTGVTTVAMAGTLTGVTSITANGAISGVTNLTMGGTLSVGGAITNVSNLTMTGTISGVTTLSTSGRITSGGGLTAGGTITGVTNLTMTGNLSLTGGSIVSLGAIEMGGTLTSTSSANFDGTVTADEFVGGGAGITGIEGTVPIGGSLGQALVKQSSTNFDMAWATVEGGGGGLVDSVFGRLGDVLALQADYAAFYATTAQGTLANTALQPNDNITELTNNAGYITAGDIPAAPVQSVFGRTDAVTADGTDYATFYLGINATASDSNRLNNQLGSFYTNSTNQITGTLPVARLAGTYNIDVSGDAQTVDGTSIEIVSVLPGAPDLNTIYFVV